MMEQTASERDLEAGRSALLGGGVGRGLPIVVERALGASLWDMQGKEYIDCTSQAWSVNVGHCHPKVIAAVTEQIKHFTHIRTSFDTVPKLLLAKKLAELAPGRLKKVAYSLTGSDANEGAMKLAMRNRPSDMFVTLWDGYHGRTLSTLNVSWPHPNNRFTAWGGPVIRVPQAYCYRCPLGLTYPSCALECVALAKQTILKNIAEPPAALMMEPIQGSGGMIDFPPDYHPAIRKMCDELGMLLIWDEIQTGFGRVGDWFAANLYHTVPDIMIIGKGLGGGFPLFGILAHEDLKPFEPGDHSFTFAHFPVSMAAALASIQAIEEENLLERGRRIGEMFTKSLNALKDKYELIGDVRGPGLMIGIELVKSKKTKEPATEETHRFVNEALKRGVIFGESKYLNLGNVVKIKPPLVITEAQVETTMRVFEEVTQQLSA
jgi:4-aminobutyrate aminotransferase-like enzyme